MLVLGAVQAAARRRWLSLALLLCVGLSALPGLASTEVGSQPASHRACPPPPQAKVQMRDDLKAGWLEKRSGDSSSLNALPVDSWKWQRRWFVLAMESGFLYYFRSPQEMTSTGVSPKVASRGSNPGLPASRDRCPPAAPACLSRWLSPAVEPKPPLDAASCAGGGDEGEVAARRLPSTWLLPPHRPSCR